MTDARITPTEDDLRDLRDAQLRHALNHINGALELGLSDDGTDYLVAALDLASLLVSLDYETDVNGLNRILLANEGDERDLLTNFASDGICPELWDAAQLNERS